jgi:hypothetical protein
MKQQQTRATLLVTERQENPDCEKVRVDASRKSWEIAWVLDRNGIQEAGVVHSWRDRQLFQVCNGQVWGS